MATGYMVHCFNQPHHHHFSFESVGTDATAAAAVTVVVDFAIAFN